MTVVERLPTVFDEPFADSSAIPTLLVSELARSSVKVALSADGGDELFCGYRSYPDTASRVRNMSRIPPRLRRPLGDVLHAGEKVLPNGAHGHRHKLESFAMSLTEKDELMAQRLHGLARLMPWSLIHQLLRGAPNDIVDFADRAWPTGIDPLEAAMGLDYQTYLKDDILTKVDRATMSVGLEGREPLLDYRLAEFAARLPIGYKYDGITGKRILRSVVHRYVPESMLDRPKAGFSLPIMSWLRGDLKPMADELLSQSSLAKSGVIDCGTAQEWIACFNRDQFHYLPLIWRLFVFQAWYERWCGNYVPKTSEEKPN